MIRYTFDVLDALSKAGYTTYKLRKDKIMGERTIQQLRTGQHVSLETIATICKLLRCQPGDILVYMQEADDGREQA